MATPYTVSQIGELIRSSLEFHFERISVLGEVTSVTKAASGHWYFSLKDAGSLLACTCWASTARRINCNPKAGQQVVVSGRLTFWGGSGKTQLNVDALQPVGVGAAEIARRLLLEKLHGLGWIDRPRRNLPAYPRRVGLVTSASGAAVRDMIQSFATRWPLCEIVVAHCRVQGDVAPAEIVAALALLNEHHQSQACRLDAIIVGRGGGSAEDLNAFNAEMVAAAIFASHVPVVSAVGHEIDVTIADLIADARAETPSNAVTKLTPHQGELKQELLATRDRLRAALHGRLIQARRRLGMIGSRPAFERPLDRIRRGEQRLDGLSERLRAAMLRRIQRSQVNVAGIAARLETVSPLNVLSRGYSVTCAADGAVIRDPSQVAVGAEIVTILAAGELRSTISDASSKRR